VRGQHEAVGGNFALLAPSRNLRQHRAQVEPEQRLSSAQALDTLPWAKPDTKTEARAVAAEKRAEAKAKGYEGESCGECGNFTLVRNGTCMKCDTCGSTTGCS